MTRLGVCATPDRALPDAAGVNRLTCGVGPPACWPETGRITVLYWLMKYVLVGPWLRLLFRPWVQGIEHIPDDGPAILASNHLSFSDSIFLPLMVDRHITFLAKSDYFTGKGIKGRLIAWFIAGVGQVPVDRTGGRASEAAISTGLRVFGQGHLLGSTPRERVQAMAVSIAVRPASRGWHWNHTCQSFLLP